MDEELSAEALREVILGLAAGSDPIDVAPLLRHDKGVVATVIAIRLLRAGYGSGIIDGHFWEVLEVAGIVGLTKHYVGQARAATAHVLDPQRRTGTGGGGYRYLFTPTEEMVLLSQHGTPAPEGVVPEPEEAKAVTATVSLSEVDHRLDAREREATLTDFLVLMRAEFGVEMFASLHHLLLEMVSREIDPDELAGALAVLLGKEPEDTDEAAAA